MTRSLILNNCNEVSRYLAQVSRQVRSSGRIPISLFPMMTTMTALRWSGSAGQMSRPSVLVQKLERRRVCGQGKTSSSSVEEIWRVARQVDFRAAERRWRGKTYLAEPATRHTTTERPLLVWKNSEASIPRLTMAGTSSWTVWEGVPWPVDLEVWHQELVAVEAAECRWHGMTAVELPFPVWKNSGASVPQRRALSTTSWVVVAEVERVAVGISS